MTTFLSTVLNPRSSNWFASLELYSRGREPWLLNFKKVVIDNQSFLRNSSFRHSVMKEIRRRKQNVELV